MNPKELARLAWQEIVTGKNPLSPEDVIEKYLYQCLNEFAHEQWKRRMTKGKVNYEESDTLFNPK